MAFLGRPPAPSLGNIVDNSDATWVTVDSSENAVFAGNVTALGATFSGNINAVAGGINLGAVGAANLLDDYEEGTWTAEVSTSTTNANPSVTSVTGYYTKIGRQVTAGFYGMNNIIKDSWGSDNIYFTMPFVAGTTVGAAVGSVRLDNVDYQSTLYTQAVCMITNTTAYAQIWSFGNGTTDNIVNAAGLTTGASDVSRFTLTYFVD